MPNDEELRKLLKPAVSEDQVRTILQDKYAAEGETVTLIRQLDAYDDQNFMVQIETKTYLFKIHNGVESRDYLTVIEQNEGEYYKAGGMTSRIHYTDAILSTLKRSNVTSYVHVPPRIHGDHNPLAPPLTVQKLPVIKSDYSPCDLVCRLLTWVHGRTMSTVKILPLASLADAGRFLGRMDAALDGMAPSQSGRVALRRVESEGNGLSTTSMRRTSQLLHQGGLDELDPAALLQDPSVLHAARKYHQWDGKHTADLRKYTSFIKDERRRRLVESILDHFQKEILDQGVHEMFRTGVNHGDFNDANIILDDEFQVVGAIDFGDSVESWRVLDVTIGMAYAMLSTYGKANCSISAAAAFLRGYNAVYPLDTLERRYLVFLMVCRLACSVTLGAFSLHLNPGNTYLLLHAEPAWKAIELVWCYDIDQRIKMIDAINRVFDQACLYSDAREKIIACHDLVIPDPTTTDLLQTVRISFDSSVKPPVKKRKNCSSEIEKRTITVVNSKFAHEIREILAVTSPNKTLDSSFLIIEKNLELPKLQGDPFQVALQSCSTAAETLGGPVIIEFTALCCNALNSWPGVTIDWFLHCNDVEHLHTVLHGYDDKTAYAQHIVAYCPGLGENVAVFDGRTVGIIVPPRGDRSLGWESVFEPSEGGGKTYAEMSKDQKDPISHRRKAFAKLREYLIKFQRIEEN